MHEDRAKGEDAAADKEMDDGQVKNNDDLHEKPVLQSSPLKIMEGSPQKATHANTGTQDFTSEDSVPIEKSDKSSAPLMSEKPVLQKRKQEKVGDKSHSLEKQASSTLNQEKKKILHESPEVDPKVRGNQRVFVMLCFGLFGVLSAIYLPYFYSLRSKPVYEPEHMYTSPTEYMASVDALKSKFLNQDDFFWKTLRNVGAKHLHMVHAGDKSDLRPLSFLVAVTNDTPSDTLNCFLKKTSRAFTNGPYLVIDSAIFASEQPERAKLLLDETIKSSLLGKQKFVVVKDIHKLSFEAVFLFMSYCDSHNDMARFPMSTMLLTMSVPGFKGDKYTQKLHELEEHFKSNWKGVENDRLGPLWARVGDAAMVMQNVTTGEVGSFCAQL